MSTLKRLINQGGVVVARDPETNEVLTDFDRKGNERPLVMRLPREPKARRESWRAFLARISNDGTDLIASLYNISQGLPHVVTHDGKQSEPQIPTAADRSRAAQYLLDMHVGKAVQQTEILAAEAESRKQEQLRAMSDEALEKFLIEGEAKELPEDK